MRELYQIQVPQLKKAALHYASLGYRIFPLKPRSKEPLISAWQEKATADPVQVAAWWKRWPDANIGLHPGPSGLIAIDKDGYKEGGADLSYADTQTITSLTGGGGEHLIYRMPAGKRYGNATGELPDNIDVRGYGGYIVVPPSIHPNGTPYEWEEGYSPDDIEPAPLPAEIAAILEQANKKPKLEGVTFKAAIDAPDLALFDISPRIRSYITDGHPAGEDRSRVDHAAVFALVDAGASNDEIRAIFEAYPIGEKYLEKGRHGEKYLAHSISKARAESQRTPFDDMEGTRLELPAGQYLTDLGYKPGRGDRVQLVANTNTGKTVWATRLVRQGHRVVLAMSSIVALEQTRDRCEREGLPVTVHYGQEKSAGPGSRLIITTYESLKNVAKLVDPSETILIIDEGHNTSVAASIDFRGRALRKVCDLIAALPWYAAITMTGTPLPTIHPVLSSFETVFVISELREQRARRVIYKDEKGRGNKTQTAANTIRREGLDKRQLVFLNDKKTQLERLRAALMVNGYEDEQIGILNADTRAEETGRYVIEFEKVPENIRVLIVTSAMIESANLKDHFDVIHIVSNLHPAMAQQLANRLRLAAAPRLYWYNCGAGNGYRIPTAEIQENTLQLAQALQVAACNQLELFNPNSDDPNQIARRRVTQTMGSQFKQLVRTRKDAEGTRYFDVSFLGVDYTTNQQEQQYCTDNPAAFKRYLRRFGWVWERDETCVLKDTDKAARVLRQAITAKLKEERIAAHNGRCNLILEQGPAWAESAFIAGTLDPEMQRTVQQLGRIERALVDHNLSADLSQPWLAAIGLVHEAQDSSRKIGRFVQQIHIQRARATGDKFVKALYKQLEFAGRDLAREGGPGRLTGEIAAATLTQVISRHPILAAEFNWKGLPWKDSKGITPTRAMRFVNLLFETKRVKDRATGGHVYLLLSRNPLPESVPVIPFGHVPTFESGVVIDAQVGTSAVENGPPEPEWEPFTIQIAAELASPT